MGRKRIKKKKRVSAMDNVDDIYYCSDEDDDYNDEEANYDSLADEMLQYFNIESPRPEQNYTILKESEILQRQEDEIKRVSTVLSISKVAASVLLLHYNWSVSKVHDAWFADEERVRKSVGLLEEPVVEFSKETRKLTCGICFEKYHCYGDEGIKIRSAACGHPFCSECWNGYISTSIKDGPGCLMLRCPDPSCIAVVGKDMVESLVSDKENKKYLRYLMRSYIECNKKTKWCPAPGCEYAIEYCGGGDGNYDVCCLCWNMFCWNCMEDAHRPVDCGTVAKWVLVLKNSFEAGNTLWIEAYSKPCPKCKRPIEKNNGCMHMTCTPPCKFEFCWLCLGPWSSHGSSTVGYYNCNIYKVAKLDGKYDEDESRTQKAKAYLEKYTHYYERWAGNETSRQKAVKDLHQMQTEHFEKLSDMHSQPKSHLGFITEAWLQIVECRRVLKWTYAYGYFFPEHEKAKKHLFEYLHGQAEHGLEMLHQCAETELYHFLTDGSPSENFNDFRNKLSGLTTVTRNYFENLLAELKNGLSDVKSYDKIRKGRHAKGKGKSDVPSH